jgi:hypothetical protein
MCYPVSCRACGKTTWDGCGQHVDEVMTNVQASQRCTCGTDLVDTIGNRVRGPAAG